jgi:nucleoside-diphosphate-sugar epimerase
MKAFVTGATGFIGGRLAKRLVERGYSVTALARSPESAAALQVQGITPVLGDIRDRESMREAMRGADVVFHVAAWYHIGGPDKALAEEINVQGTRNVLGLAHELGVPKIVYTSTLAVYGDTRGRVLDENEPRPAGPFLTEYDRTKSMAHFDVAVPLIQQGAPVIIVQPGGVYGPGDHSQLGEMMAAFFKGWFVVFPAPDLTIAVAHVDDVVEGHLLAAEKGRLGQNYFLAGPVFKMKDLVQLWARVTGRPAPLFYLPPGLVQPIAPLLGWLEKVIPLPSLINAESVRIAAATYPAHAEKARAELGWQPRPVEEGLRQTFAAMSETIPVTPEEVRQKQSSGILVAALSALVVFWWMTRRRRR